MRDTDWRKRNKERNGKWGESLDRETSVTGKWEGVLADTWPAILGRSNGERHGRK